LRRNAVQKEAPLSTHESGSAAPAHSDVGSHPPAGGPLAFTFGSWFTWTAVGVAFPALGVLLVVAAGPLAEGSYEALPAFAAAHTATLGWATMTIMGGAMQMAPALLGARVRAERSVPWLYSLFTLSVLAVITGFLAGRFAFVAVGGVGVICASWWFLIVMVLTIASARARLSVVSPQIPAALCCFVLVLLWGTALAANLRWGFWPALLVAHRGLVVHLALGVGGWLGLMVVGTFYRLVPLVHGARVASSRRGWGILCAGLLAVAATLAGSAWGIGWPFRAAALLASCALVLFALEILHILAHRRSRVPDLNVSHWRAVVAHSAVLACVGVGWAMGWMGSDPPGRLGEGVVVVFLLGWVTQAIIGQLYKITPFLMWYYRATIPDVLAIPRQPAPYHPRPGRIVLWLTNMGVAGLAVGVWWGAPSVARAGAAMLAVGAGVLAYLLAYRWIPPAVGRTLPFEWRWRIS
jgi:hypothetical protein